MQAVITEQQARQITGGRKPLVPVEYEAACKALAECVDLDESKCWADKADALAAWAKIYHDDKVAVTSKRLKLKAYRRMGEIAAELRPRKILRGQDGRSLGNAPGPVTLLVEKGGLTKGAAENARRLARMPLAKFDEIVNLAIPPGPNLAGKMSGSSDIWQLLTQSNMGLMKFRSFCRGNQAKALARGLYLNEATAARSAVLEVQEWLDEFEQHLPK